VLSDFSPSSSNGTLCTLVLPAALSLLIGMGGGYGDGSGECDVAVSSSVCTLNGRRCTCLRFAAAVAVAIADDVVALRAGPAICITNVHTDTEAVTTRQVIEANRYQGNKDTSGSGSGSSGNNSNKNDRRNRGARAHSKAAQCANKSVVQSNNTQLDRRGMERV
jgi:hypothetical protein